MPGMFIDVQVSGKAATDPAIAKKLAEVCPVNIFAADGGHTLRKGPDLVPLFAPLRGGAD